MARDYLEQLFGLSGQVAVVVGGTGRSAPARSDVVVVGGTK